MAPRTYYEMLGVSPKATRAELKSAYRQMAMKWHPDRNRAGNAEATFKRINEAYDCLSNSLDRAAYDRKQREAATGTGPKTGAGGATSSGSNTNAGRNTKAESKPSPPPRQPSPPSPPRPPYGLFALALAILLGWGWVMPMQAPPIATASTERPATVQTPQAAPSPPPDDGAAAKAHEEALKRAAERRQQEETERLNARLERERKEAEAAQRIAEQKRIADAEAERLRPEREKAAEKERRLSAMIEKLFGPIPAGGSLSDTPLLRGFYIYPHVPIDPHPFSEGFSYLDDASSFVGEVQLDEWTIMYIRDPQPGRWKGEPARSVQRGAAIRGP